MPAPTARPTLWAAAAAGRRSADRGMSSIGPRGDRALAALAVHDDVDPFVEERDAVPNRLGVVQRIAVRPGQIRRAVGQRVVRRTALVGAIGHRAARLE